MPPRRRTVPRRLTSRRQSEALSRARDIGIGVASLTPAGRTARVATTGARLASRSAVGRAGRRLASGVLEDVKRRAFRVQPQILRSFRRAEREAIRRAQQRSRRN